MIAELSPSVQPLPSATARHVQPLLFIEELPLPWPDFREVWRPIPGQNEVEVSSNGRVRTFRTRSGQRRPEPKALKGSRNRCGYRLVCVGSRRTGKWLYLHQAVMLAFVGPQPPDRRITRHLNGNAEDCSVNNLAHGTQRQNYADALRHGTVPLGTKRRGTKLNDEKVLEIVRRIEGGESQTRVARSLSVSITAVAHVWYGRRWTWLTKRSAA